MPPAQSVRRGTVLRAPGSARGAYRHAPLAPPSQACDGLSTRMCRPRAGSPRTARFEALGRLSPHIRAEGFAASGLGAVVGEISPRACFRGGYSARGCRGSHLRSSTPPEPEAGHRLHRRAARAPRVRRRRGGLRGDLRPLRAGSARVLPPAPGRPAGGRGRPSAELRAGLQRAAVRPRAELPEALGLRDRAQPLPDAAGRATRRHRPRRRPRGRPAHRGLLRRGAAPRRRRGARRRPAPPARRPARGARALRARRHSQQRHRGGARGRPGAREGARVPGAGGARPGPRGARGRLSRRPRGARDAARPRAAPRAARRPPRALRGLRRVRVRDRAPAPCAGGGHPARRPARGR